METFIFNCFLIVFHVQVISNAELNRTESDREIPVRYMFDDDSVSKAFDITFRRNPSVVVKKCCPWGAFFDVDALTCEVPPGGRTGNFTPEEMDDMELSFLRRYVRNHPGRGQYDFSIGLFPCDHTKVFTSQLTREFSLESGVPKLDGKPIKERYCIDGSHGGGTVLLRCHHEKICKDRPCLRKCMPFGEFFGKEDEGILELPRMTKDFYDLKTLQVDRFVTFASFGLYLGNPCGGRGRSILEPDVEPGDTYYIGSDGRLHVPETEEKFYKNEEYCVEYVKGENVSDVQVFLCFPEEHFDIKYYILAGCFIISCVFLLATFLVYLFSPKIQILYGKSLMCYVASLFSAYLVLAIIQINSDKLEYEGCTFAGYSTLFFFLAAFSWLNIMSIDMWKTFRSTRLARFNRSSKANIQFLWYSLYAWSLPTVLTGLTAAADFVDNFVPAKLKPGIGNPSCWFSPDTKGIHIFFITPISLLILCNTILFIDTAWRCWKIKLEISRMGNQSKKKYAANKTQLIINAKLFIAMGVVWSLEVISFFFDHPIWYLSDAANALHGVFIFAVFVMKKKVLSGLQHRIQKPFIRMKNIKKKSVDDNGGLDDPTTVTGRKNLSRSSSTNLTEVST